MWHGESSRLVMATSIPLLFVGYWLLEWLAGSRADLLRLILGVRDHRLEPATRAKAPAAARTVGDRIVPVLRRDRGVMGGMFSTAGPPLVYHFYRQPMSLVMVRETLVTVFAVNAVVRIGLVAGPAIFRQDQRCPAFSPFRSS